MFREPDINDYIGWIRYHLDQHANRAVAAIGVVRRKAAAAGALISGNTVISAIDSSSSEFEHGLEFAFGSLRWSVKHTLLNEDQLRDTTVQLLENFKIQMKAIAEIPEIAQMPNRTIVDRKLQEFDERLSFLTRNFDVGFFLPKERAMVIKTDNSINIHSMTGGAIQHGSPAAVQVVDSSINVEIAKQALQSFEKALAELELDRETAVSLKADVDTLRAQLAKASPSMSILREAGNSARNIIEGVAAGLLTPSVLAAAPALWSALGLG